MYDVLTKLYDNEIKISKFIFLETKKNLSADKEIIIMNCIIKLNKLLVDLTIECNNYIDKILKLNDTNKHIKIRKYIKTEEYIQTYIFNLKALFIENINISYEDKSIIDITNDNIIDNNFTNETSKIYPRIENIEHKNKIGFDIEPEHESIIKKDFFEYHPDTYLYNNILTIGNPPFGRVCSLAIKFFNHAAKFSNVIAFIIPRSFRKVSMQNKLDINFKLIYDMDISNKLNTFDPPINVKCCFQIWVRTNNKRIIKKLDIKHKDWKFLNYKKDDILLSDFAIRAYGGKCGEIVEYNFDMLNCKGWHFIKSNINIDQLKSNMLHLDFKNSKNTARQNSLGKAELVDLYTKKNNFI